MKNRLHKSYFVAIGIISAVLLTALSGCGESRGYTTESLFDEQITSVYVEMFDNRTFERGVEYELTDALAKRIEAATPYKIVSSRDRADTVISGYISNEQKAVLTAERQTGRPMEKEITLTAVVNWKNIRNGKMLIDNKQVVAAASFSEWQQQGTAYGSALAANKLAKGIVELMENPW
ncbi:MAG: LPS assembly lipoprotein LptE [Phycisphaerae bacterium]